MAVVSIRVSTKIYFWNSLRPYGQKNEALLVNINPPSKESLCLTHYPLQLYQNRPFVKPERRFNTGVDLWLTSQHKDEVIVNKCILETVKQRSTVLVLHHGVSYMVIACPDEGRGERKAKVQCTANHIKEKYKCSHPMYPSMPT